MVSLIINSRDKVRKQQKKLYQPKLPVFLVVLDSMSVIVSLLEAVYLMTVSALCKTGYRKLTGKVL